MIAMFGWFSEARTFASRWNRAIGSASAANASGRILMATSRSSRVSRARYTSPMPPAPSAESISYGPMRVPGARAKTLIADYMGGPDARTGLLLCDELLFIDSSWRWLDSPYRRLRSVTLGPAADRTFPTECRACPETLLFRTRWERLARSSTRRLTTSNGMRPGARLIRRHARLQLLEPVEHG